MTIRDLLKDEDARARNTMVLAATAAGVTNIVILVLVTEVAQSPGTTNLRLFLAFLFALTVYVVCARHTYNWLTDAIESALHQFKLRLVDKIMKAELLQIEKIGSTTIYDRLTENMNTVSDATGVIANVLQSLVITGVGALYIAYISPMAFFLLVGLNAVAITIYLARNRRIRRGLHHTTELRSDFFDRLTDMLRGFKELKLNQKRQADLQADIRQASTTLKNSTMDVQHLFDENWIFQQSCHNHQVGW